MRETTRRLMRACLAGCLLLAGLGMEAPGAAPRNAGPAVYRLDPRASRFIVHVASSGLLAFAGHSHEIAIRDFRGEARFPAGVPTDSASLQITIPAAAMGESSPHFSPRERRAIDRAMRAQALEAGKYPQVVFRSTRVAVHPTGPGTYHADIMGSLTLHGVTLPVTVPADVTLHGGQLRATGSFTVKHSDFKMKRISAAGGTVIAGNTMKLQFDVVGHRR